MKGKVGKGLIAVVALVAAVAAIDEDTAEEALDLIEVEYEPLAAVFDPEQAMQPGAPLVHDNAPGNVCAQVAFEFGEVDKAFSRVAYVREDVFETQPVKQGMLEARGKYRLFMDSDNSVPIDYFDKFLPYFSQGYDVVIGSIEVAGAKIEEHAAWYRRLLGHWAKLLIRFMAIWEIHDTQRGFKIFSEKAAREVFPLQTLTRWGFDIEILVISKNLGFRIKELPVTWNNPAGSKVTLGAYFTTLRDLLIVKKNLIFGKYNARKTASKNI